MRLDIIAVLPHFFDSVFDNAIYRKAIQAGLIEIKVHDLRDYSQGAYRQIDDYAYGGQAGMVIMAEPLANCIDTLKAACAYDEIIYLTPDGETFNQSLANQFSLKSHLLIICGHYKGIDQRIRDIYVTKEISIGDYVLSGGETAAAVIMDAICRIIPGVIGDETSALTDSHQDGLLSGPVYTRPAEFKGHKVPEVLLSGHEKKIEEWNHDQALKQTEIRRPDLWKKWGSEK